MITITIKVVNDKANDKDRHKNAPNRKRLDNQRAILTQNGNHQFCVKIRKVEKHNQTYQNKIRFGQQKSKIQSKIQRCKKEQTNPKSKIQDEFFSSHVALIMTIVQSEIA